MDANALPENLPIDGLLAGQSALVTGAGRGIGRAIAIRLALAGARVGVADLNSVDAQQTARIIVENGHQAIAITADVTSDASRRAMVNSVEDAFGPLDLLVNNAGINQVIDPFDITEADWDRMLAVNAKAVFFLSQQVLRGMVERKRGGVVSLASVAGKIATGVPYLHYNVSKAAVIAMTKTLSQAVARNGVRVNCVCPGIIDTDMWTMIDREQGQKMLGMGDREFMNSRLANVPMGRAGTPDDVARVILFLASPLAAYMTGQAVNITGGWVTF